MVAVEEARGFTGGIWVLSQDVSLHCTVVEIMHQAIMFSVGKCGEEWTYAAIYPSPTPSIRASFW